MTLNAALVADVSAPEVATRVYPFAARSRLRPENPAKPTLAMVVSGPVSVAPPGLLASAIETVAVAEVTVLPNGSSMATRTRGAIGWPATTLLGCTRKARRVAATAVTFTVAFTSAPSASVTRTVSMTAASVPAV